MYKYSSKQQQQQQQQRYNDKQQTEQVQRTYNVVYSSKQYPVSCELFVDNLFAMHLYVGCSVLYILLRSPKYLLLD